MHTNTDKLKRSIFKVALGLALFPALGQSTFAEEVRVNSYIENATYLRKDVGLSKFRNTLQIEAEKTYKTSGIFSNVSLSGTFRLSYDGVYDLNDEDFGKKLEELFL